MANIYEIAERAGVSPKTAARILAGGSKRSKHHAKVLACAQALGYVRNQQAANLRTGRSRLVGILVPYIDNPFYTKFLQEMHDALKEKSYQSMIACSFGRADDMVSALKLFDTYNVDGIALDISEGTLTPEISQLLQQMRKRKRAIVITGAQLHDIAYDHLYLDNKSAVAKLVRHLSARGHKTVGFLGGMPDNLNIKNRLESLKQSLREQGLVIKTEWIALGDPSIPSVLQRAHQLLRGKDRPTAIVCTSDMIAMAAMRAASEAGLRVPDDVAISGFDDIEQAGLMNPGLTTLRQPMEVMAKDIVELLLRPGKPRNKPIEEKRYEAELVIREST